MDHETTKHRVDRSIFGPHLYYFPIDLCNPLVMVFATSLFDYRLLPRTFEFIGFSNFIKLFTQDAKFLPVLKNTVVWIAIHCVLHVALGTVLAFILYKKPHGWKFVRVTYMIPNIISQSCYLPCLFGICTMRSDGALNSLLKAIGLEHLQHNWLFDTATAFPAVTMTWFIFAGYTTTLVLAQCLSTDESIIEAAKIDGATSFQIDRLVMFPLVKRMIGTTVIMAATYMLQMFSMIYITTGGGPGVSTANLPLYLYTTVKANNYGYANSIGVVIIIVGFITMTLINRLFGMNKED